MKVKSLETLAMLGLMTGDASSVIEYEEKSGQMELCSEAETVEIPRKENFPKLDFSTFAEKCVNRKINPESQYSHICTELKRKKVKSEVLSLKLKNYEHSKISKEKVTKYSPKKKHRFYVTQNIRKKVHDCWKNECLEYEKACFEDYKNKLKKIGISVVDEENDGDNLFIKVKLPEKWKIERTDHHMWSNLLDEKGRRRASIFYKAVFYDREAFISFQRRFGLSFEIPDYDEKKFEEKPEYIEDGFEDAYVNTNTGQKINIKKACSYDNRMNYFDEYGNELVEYSDDGLSFRVCAEKRKVPKYKKNPEYVPLTGYEKYSQPFHYEVRDFDDSVLFKSDVVRTNFEYSKEKHREFFDHRENLQKQLKTQCIDWLNKHYPDWESDFSYWD